jgi:hypothetical protein
MPALPVSQTGGRDDQLLRITRILAAFIVPVLVVAFGILFLFPERSGELFAWPVRPNMTAMMLGAAYLGGAYYFTRAALTKQWHTIALGLNPVSGFAGLLGVATILHWDRFTPGHISFILWVILYMTLPIVLLVVWYVNRRADPLVPDADYPPMPMPVRGALGLVGAGMTAVSLLLFVAPEVLIPAWPWTLTPLTSRVMGAMFMLPALVGIKIALDGRWSAARYILQAQIFSIALILVAAVIARADFDWSQAISWAFAVGMALLGALLLALYVWMESRRRR